MEFFEVAQRRGGLEGGKQEKGSRFGKTRGYLLGPLRTNHKFLFKILIR